MSLQTNAGDAGARLRRVAAAVRREVEREGDSLAARIEVDMKLRAPKGQRSTLANSVRDEKKGPFEHFIGPQVDYAPAVEKGRKPGKGLPFFGTPEAAGAMAWLEARVADAARKLNPKYRRGAKGSARRSVEDLELRIAYFLWSKKVKLRGIKAQPFVKPTAEAWRKKAPDALLAAVRRATALLNGGAA